MGSCFALLFYHFVITLLSFSQNLNRIITTNDYHKLIKSRKWSTSQRRALDRRLLILNARDSFENVDFLKHDKYILRTGKPVFTNDPTSNNPFIILNEVLFERYLIESEKGTLPKKIVEFALKGLYSLKVFEDYLKPITRKQIRDTLFSGCLRKTVRDAAINAFKLMLKRKRKPKGP